MDVKEIIFTPTIGVDFTHYPVPAKDILPEWYKKTESYMGGEKKIDISDSSKSTATVKRCMPLFDALTAGYIIPTPFDIEVKIEEGKSIYYSEWLVEFHTINQAPLYPHQTNKRYFPKFINPWIIQTPKGTSCFFTSPIHRELPFKILEGIVDTDSYFVPINFPFVLTNDNFEGVIPAGTPMAHIIPFVRNDWKMKFGGIDSYKEGQEAEQKLYSLKHDRYKNIFRKIKSYK